MYASSHILAPYVLEAACQVRIGENLQAHHLEMIEAVICRLRNEIDSPGFAEPGTGGFVGTSDDQTLGDIVFRAVVAFDEEFAHDPLDPKAHLSMYFGALEKTIQSLERLADDGSSEPWVSSVFLCVEASALAA